MTEYPAIEFAEIISAHEHISPGTGTRSLYLELKTKDLLEIPERSPTDHIFTQIKFSNLTAVIKALGMAIPSELDKSFMESLIGLPLRLMVELESKPPLVTLKVVGFYPEKGKLVEYKAPVSLLTQIAQIYKPGYDTLNCGEKEAVLNTVRAVVEATEQVTGTEILEESEEPSIGSG